MSDEYREQIREEDMTDPDANRCLLPDLTTDFMIEKCEYFAGIGIWPRKSVLDPESWLRNFQPAEADHALYLLNAFMYFSEELLHEIFAAAFRSLSRYLVQPGDTCTTLTNKWKSFLDRLVVTYPTDENPNPADSGHVFARKARSLGIPEDQIWAPERVCLELTRGLDRPIVFVDDFVGSGNQFHATWSRQYGQSRVSFRDLSPVITNEFYYCPAFCTEFGMNRILIHCPKVKINPGHLLSSSYSALSPESILWPPRLRSTAVEFVRCTSERAGIPDTGGTRPNDWRGFAGLGLTIALGDCVPDATLPIFSWSKNGWRPLIQVGSHL